MASIVITSPAADLVNQYCASKAIDPSVFAIGALMAAIAAPPPPREIKRRGPRRKTVAGPTAEPVVARKRRGRGKAKAKDTA